MVGIAQYVLLFYMRSRLWTAVVPMDTGRSDGSVVFFQAENRNMA